jgi:hypothetical protein
MNKLSLKTILMITATMVLVGNNIPQNASRTIASTVSSEECQQKNRLASLKKESDKLEKKLNNINQLMIMSRARQNGIKFHVITESAYVKWSRANPGYSQQSIDRYHQQVMRRRQQFANKVQTSSSLSFDKSGNISNSLYGQPQLYAGFSEQSTQTPPL